MNEKISIRVNDNFIEKKAAAGDLMRKVSFTKVCGIVLLFSSILIYATSLMNKTASFVCCAIFMIGSVFIIFKAEQDMNYYHSTYGIEKPQFIKQKINLGVNK